MPPAAQVLAAINDPARLQILAEASAAPGGLDGDSEAGAANPDPAKAEKARRSNKARLTAAGLLTEDGKLDLAPLAAAQQDVQSLRARAAAFVSAGAEAVAGAFAEGQIASVPSNPDERDALLGWIMDTALASLGNGPWSEREITAALTMIARDPATLRGALVDHGHLTRSPDGAEYSTPTRIAVPTHGSAKAEHTSR